MNILELIMRFMFVHMLDNIIIAMATIVICGLKLDFKKLLKISALSSLISEFIYTGGTFGFLQTGFIMCSIALSIIIIYNYNIGLFPKLIKSMLISMVLILVLQTLVYMPFILFLDIDMSVVNSSIYSTIVLSIPSRVLSYVVIYMLYIKKRR